MKPGLFIVLEGSDGSGKATQLKLLAGRLRAIGHDVDEYDFPRYDEPSSYFVRQYLNGKYGPAGEISPYTASLFYALDRFEAATQIRRSLKAGKLVLANRYVGSNMAHQGSKFTNEGEQRGFFVWADSLEFQLLGIPRPNLNIFLRVPAEISYELIKSKQPRGYTNKTHDEHEADLGHLRRTVLAYDTLCRLFSKDFKSIECTKSKRLLQITEINNRIWELVKPMMPRPRRSGRSAVVNLNSTPEVSKIVTPPAAVASAEEPKIQEYKDMSLLSINNLITATVKPFEYNTKWPPEPTKARMYYFVPPQLSQPLVKEYRQSMDKLAEYYNEINKRLRAQAAKNKNSTALESLEVTMKALVPMAALGDVTLSDQEIINAFIRQGRSSELPETQQFAEKLAKQSGRHEKPGQPAAIKKIIKQIAGGRLSHYAADNDDSAQLLDAWPRNEFDLLVECLYPYSNLSRDDIIAELDHWPYEQKSAALKSAYRQAEVSPLEMARYRFDILSDRIDFESFLSLVKPQTLQLQPPTPRYGYNVPDVVEQAGVDALFLDCFDLSLKLFSDIQAEGHDQLAGYAVLGGHKQRWQIAVSASELYKPNIGNGRGHNHLINALRGKIGEAHPILAESAKDRPSAHTNIKDIPANRPEVHTAKKSKKAKPKK